MFVKMPKTRSSFNTTQPTSLRRSPRLLLHKNLSQPQTPPNPEPKPTTINNNRVGMSPSSTPNASLKKTQKHNPENSSKKSTKSNDGSIKNRKLVTGLRRSPRLNKGVDRVSCLRRSPRLSHCKNETDKYVDNVGGDKKKQIDGNAKKISNDGSRQFRVNGEKKGNDKSKRFDKKVGNVSGDKWNRLSDNEVSLGGENEKLGVNSCEQYAANRVRRSRRSGCVDYADVVAEGEDGKVRDVEEGNKKDRVKRKRKRGEVGVEVVQGWTKEQEMALQRAYFASKPTPHFWKKVAKLVPGKSAQACFDKVHSDHLTPPQPRPRSRANRTQSSSEGLFTLSASKLLKATKTKTKNPRRKQRNHLAQKTVRHLLQRHYNVDKDCETDLFSVLEPTVNPPPQAFQQSVILSTPEHGPERWGFLQKCHERSSLGHKKALSRFSSSCETPIVSPPVLKQVKNRALHERYIDQLHSREAKRKAASAGLAKSTSRNEDRKDSHVQKLDVVKAAKNALVSDAKDAINQFRHLQANATSESPNSDDGVDDHDDDNDDEGDDVH